MSNIIKKTNTSFLDMLKIVPDDYPTIDSLSEREILKLGNSIKFMSTGAGASIPMICPGASKCFLGSICPIAKLDRERVEDGLKPVMEIGKRCLVEAQLIHEWTNLYIEEYQIDDGDFTEFMMIRELAEIELMLWRINNNMAKPEYSQFVEENCVGVNNEGEAIYRKEISPLFDVKEKLLNRKHRLIKLMVGDRQEKYRREAALKIQSTEDPSSNSAKLREQINKLLKHTEDLNKTIIEVKPEDLIGE